MLTKNTKLGTKVVGLDPMPSIHNYVHPEWIEQAKLISPAGHENKIFVVNRIIVCEVALKGFAVTFIGDSGWWPLECYHPLDLPESLSSLVKSNLINV